MAKKHDMKLIKSRTVNTHSKDYGEYQIVNRSTNSLVAGEHFDMTLNEVEEWLNEYKLQNEEE